MDRIILLITFILLCGISVYGNYECICNYAVENPVFSRPDNSTVPLGLLYEFDCKALDRTLSTNEWWAILFYHEIAYVRTTSKLMEQACTGSVPLQDIITTTQRPTNTLTVVYGKSTTNQTISNGPTNGTYQTRRKITALLPTLQGHPSTVHSSSLGTNIFSNGRTTMHYISPNTSWLNSTDSYENTAKTRQSTSYPLSISQSNSSGRNTYFPSNKTGLTLLFSKYSSTGDPIQHTTNPINITRPFTSTHTVQSNNFTLIYNLSMNNTSPKNVYISTMSYGTKRNVESSQNFHNYTYTPRMTTIVTRPPRNTTIGRFTVTDVNVTSIHPSRNYVSSSNQTRNVTTGRFNLTSIIPVSTSSPSNTTSGHFTLTVNNTTINHANHGVTEGISNSTLKVSKNVVSLIDNITRVSNMATNDKPKYTLTPSGSFGLNHTRTPALFPLQNITTPFLLQETSTYSNTRKPSYHFNKTRVTYNSEVPTVMYETTLSQKQSSNETTIQNIFTAKSTNVNTTRKPAVSNHTRFSHSQSWDRFNTTTDTSYSTRLSTIRFSMNSTITDGITTTTDAGFGEETSDTFVQSYERETFTPSEIIKQHSFIPSEVTSQRPHAVSNTHLQNKQTTSAQSLQKPTTDKWTVELCPYYMLSKTIFNGALDHPYPLVRTDGNNCYEFNTKIDNWFNARSECKEKGGDLVVIKSQRVETTLQKMLRELNITGEVWIGLTNLNEDGKWHWVIGNHTDGFKFENWDAASYTDPVISLRRNCATMDGRTGKWRTRACQTYLFYPAKYQFICQYKIS